MAARHKGTLNIPKKYRAENGTDNAGTGNTAVGPDAASGEILTARPSVNGRLHVEGTQLVDENGTAVQLRGISMHGLTWYPDYLNESLSRQLSEDWNCSLLRLPMYSEIYCKNKKGQGRESRSCQEGDQSGCRPGYVRPGGLAYPRRCRP